MSDIIFDGFYVCVHDTRIILYLKTKLCSYKHVYKTHNNIQSMQKQQKNYPKFANLLEKRIRKYSFYPPLFLLL